MMGLTHSLMLTMRPVQRIDWRRKDDNMANPNDTTSDPWDKVKRLECIVWPESDYSAAYAEMVESLLGYYYDADAVDEARREDAKTIANLHAKLREAKEEMDDMRECVADMRECVAHAEGERDELRYELEFLRIGD